MQKNLEYAKSVKDRPAKAAATKEGQLAPTPPDIEGPFYKAGAPFMDDQIVYAPTRPEETLLFVSGRVRDTDGQPLSQAVLDIWHADMDGRYDNDGYTMRGKVRACGSDGSYQFKTIVPGDYQIAENPADFRCAHVHVRVSAPGCKTLTTQLYFPNDPYNATDHWFDARRVIDPKDAVFDFVLEKGEDMVELEKAEPAHPHKPTQHHHKK